MAKERSNDEIMVNLTNMMNGIQGDSALDESQRSEEVESYPTQQLMTDEEAPQSQAQETQREAPRKRIYHGKYERERAAREQAEQLAMYRTQEVDNLRQQLEEERARTEATVNHALELKESYAQEVLREALENGDLDKQAEANKLLLKFATEKAVRENIPKQQEQYQDYNYVQNYPAYTPTPAENPVFSEWLEENQWYDPESINYDQSLVEEADIMADELNKILKMEGAADQIGSAEYFTMISHAMHSKYKTGRQADKQQDYAQSAQPSQRQLSRPQTYAPVTNTMTNTGGYRTNTGNGSKISLTSEQREFARKLPLYDATNRPLSDEQKYVAFANSLRSESPQSRR